MTCASFKIHQFYAKNATNKKRCDVEMSSISQFCKHNKLKFCSKQTKNLKTILKTKLSKKNISRRLKSISANFWKFVTMNRTKKLILIFAFRATDQGILFSEWNGCGNDQALWRDTSLFGTSEELSRWVNFHFGFYCSTPSRFKDGKF